MLPGRSAERRLLQDLVDSARRGQAGAVLLRGEPGIGKSALLDDLATAPESADLLVLRTLGVEQEAPLAFAALHRLLRPVAGSADALPDPQARALRVAFGQESGGPVDPFLVGVATLSLLGAAAETATVLCLVDDAHWLDEASAQALLFAVRRLQAERVAVVLAARDRPEPAFSPAGVAVLSVAGLTDAESAAILRAQGQIAAEVVERLVGEARGNPLALRSLPTALSAEQRAGTAALPALLAPGEGLGRVLLDLARRLSEGAQRVLLVVASGEDVAVDRTRSAAARLGLSDGDWDQAERSGLLVVSDSEARISHPLLRSAIYAGATSAERRAAHHALAEAAEEAGDADHAVGHRALASTGPDDGLAVALAHLGARAAARGGFAAAADAYERATERALTQAVTSPWLLAAGTCSWAAGQPARAALLAVRARQRVSEPGGDSVEDPILLADVDRLLARLEVNIGSAEEGHRILSTAASAVAPHDRDRAVEMAVAAALMQGYGIDSGVRVPPGLLSTQPQAGDVPRTACLTALLRSMTHANAGEWSQARTALGTAMRSADSLSGEAVDLDVWGNLGNAALHVGDHVAAARGYSEMRRHAVHAGSGMAVLYALHRLGFAEYPAGRWQQVRSDAHEAIALADSLGQPALTAVPCAWLALLAALQGADAYDDLRGRCDELVGALRLGILTEPANDLLRWADGVRAAATGDPQRALHHFGRMKVPTLRRMTALDRIEAAARADERTRAQGWVDELDGFGRAAGWAWARAVADHGRALLAGREPETAGHFQQAAAGIAADAARPFDLARIQLAHGEWLRRAGQRMAARSQLRASLETFADLGAEPWTRRASEELRASGETARKRNPSTLLALTPMERKVAELVAIGLSNKDVAAQCWISPRTVAFHLRNVFAKTGVTSRGELGPLLLAGG